MAYIDQDKKKKLSVGIKKILKKYGIKGSLSVNNNTQLDLWIKSGSIDFIGCAIDLINNDYRNRDSHEKAYLTADLQENRHWEPNIYWLQNLPEGDAKNALIELRDAMNVGNHDNSNSQVDYFDVGWYINISVGRWDRPYELIK